MYINKVKLGVFLDHPELSLFWVREIALQDSLWLPN